MRFSIPIQVHCDAEGCDELMSTTARFNAPASETGWPLLFFGGSAPSVQLEHAEQIRDWASVDGRVFCQKHRDEAQERLNELLEHRRALVKERADKYGYADGLTIVGPDENGLYHDLTLKRVVANFGPEGSKL